MLAPRRTALNRPLLVASTLATSFTLGIALTACGQAGSKKTVLNIPREVPGVVAPNVEANFVSLADGGNWNVQLKNDKKFTLSDKARKIAIKGKWQETPKGFTTLVIDEATESGQPSPEFSPGETAIALNIPGHAVAIRLDGMNGPNSIFLLAPGACPTGALRNMQWVALRRTEPTAPVSGLLDWSPSTRKITVSRAFDVEGKAVRGHPMSIAGDFKCSNGVASGPGTRIRFMQDDSAIIERAGADQRLGTEDDEIVVASRADQPNPQMFRGEFAGFRIPDPRGMEPLQPFTLKAARGGVMSVEFLAADLATPSGEVITLDRPRILANSRLVHATYNGGTGHLTCSTRNAAGARGQRTILCVGSDDGGASTYNLIATTQEGMRPVAPVTPASPRPSISPTPGRSPRPAVSPRPSPRPSPRRSPRAGTGGGMVEPGTDNGTGGDFGGDFGTGTGTEGGDGG